MKSDSAHTGKPLRRKLASIHPDEWALIRAVALHPMDITPRCALADWLMERDDPVEHAIGLRLAQALQNPTQHEIDGPIWGHTLALPRVGSGITFSDYWAGYPKVWHVYRPFVWRRLRRYYPIWPIHEVRLDWQRPRRLTSIPGNVYNGYVEHGWYREGIPGSPLESQVRASIWCRLVPHACDGNLAIYLSEKDALRDLGYATVNARRARLNMPEVDFPRPWWRRTRPTHD